MSIPVRVLKEPKYYAACRVGRLVEARLEWLGQASDVEAFQRDMSAAFTRAGAGAIVCADWRKADVLPPEVGDALIEMLRRGNRRFERSAVLLSPATLTFNLQVERLFREAANPARRAFRDAAALSAWLAEVLESAELQQVEALLKG